MNRNKTAVLKVQYALEHHAKPLKPIFEALQYALDYNNKFYHRILSARGGMNSNYIELSNGRYFIIRGRLSPKPYISVREGCTSNEIKLFNARDAVRFVSSL
jgi:hypothetical protein